MNRVSSLDSGIGNAIFGSKKPAASLPVLASPDSLTADAEAEAEKRRRAARNVTQTIFTSPQGVVRDQSLLGS